MAARAKPAAANHVVSAKKLFVRACTITVGEDGSVAISARLPATDGAVVLQALRAAAGDCEHPHRPHRDPAEGGPADGRVPPGTPAGDAGPGCPHSHAAARHGAA